VDENLGYCEWNSDQCNEGILPMGPKWHIDDSVHPTTSPGAFFFLRRFLLLANQNVIAGHLIMTWYLIYMAITRCSCSVS
jgi:hypothetical protein